MGSVCGLDLGLSGSGDMLGSDQVPFVLEDVLNIAMLGSGLNVLTQGLYMSVNRAMFELEFRLGEWSLMVGSSTAGKKVKVTKIGTGKLRLFH